MKLENYHRITKSIPLKPRVQVSIWCDIVDLLVELGIKKDSPWGEDEEELLQKVNAAASKAAEEVIERFNKWEADGRPT